LESTENTDSDELKNTVLSLKYKKKFNFLELILAWFANIYFVSFSSRFGSFSIMPAEFYHIFFYRAC